MKQLEKKFTDLDFSGTATRREVFQLDGGNHEALDALREILVWPKIYSKQARELGVRWPSGLLLYGPPGCGKTMLTMAVCRGYGYVVKTVSVASVFAAYLGESEKNLREIFNEATEMGKSGESVVLFFDEIDALCPKRSADKPHESRVVSQLLTLLDEVAMSQGCLSESNGRLVIIGATNQPNILDPALRRPGRFDREVQVGIPPQEQRYHILRFHSKELKLSDGVNLKEIASLTNGYSGADLSAACREAAMQSITRSGLEICLEDFKKALCIVPPSVGKGYEVEVSPVEWKQIGGLEHVKERLKQAAEWPLLHKEAFQRLGLTPTKGILLYGPSGCCKTTLAKAVATGSGARLIPLSCAQIYSMYSGEGESIIRDAFHRARLAAPSILFLDEVDALASARSSGEREGSVAGAQLLSCLLTEMDGLEQVSNILVMAATNQPEVLDSAFIRPGRIDMSLFVGLPDQLSRKQILSIHTEAIPLSSDVDLETLAQGTKLFTGAELAALCSEAALCALRDDVAGASVVRQRHFERSLQGIHPSVTKEKIEAYKSWGSKNKLLNLNLSEEFDSV